VILHTNFQALLIDTDIIYHYRVNIQISNGFFVLLFSGISFHLKSNNYILILFHNFFCCTNANKEKSQAKINFFIYSGRENQNVSFVLCYV